MTTTPTPDATPPALVLDLGQGPDADPVAVPLTADEIADQQARADAAAAAAQAAADAAAQREQLVTQLQAGTATQDQVQAALAQLLGSQ